MILVLDIHLMISLFPFIQIFSQNLKKEKHFFFKKAFPKINRENLTVTLKILLVILNVLYFTNKYSSLHHLI